MRAHNNQLKLNDLTAMISEIPAVFDLISRGGYFAMEGKTQNTVVFDREEDTLVIGGTANRSARGGRPSTRSSAAVHTLQIPHFKEFDAIYVDDLEGYRQLGTAEQAKTLAGEKAKRLAKLKAVTEQSHEMMRFYSLIGISKDPHGNDLFNPYTEFNITQKSVDFELGTATTNLDEKIDEIISHQVDTMNMGIALGLPHVYVSKAFFSAFTNHETIKDSYRDYQNAGAQRLRDNLTDFYVGFKVRTFEHRGVLFIEYNPTFKVLQSDGVTINDVQVMNEANKEGFAVPTSTGGAVAPIYRGFLGPERKFNGLAKAGIAMYAREYGDKYDEMVEIEVESNPLFICTKPQGVVRVHSSN